MKVKKLLALVLAGVLTITSAGNITALAGSTEEITIETFSDDINSVDSEIIIEDGTETESDGDESIVIVSGDEDDATIETSSEEVKEADNSSDEMTEPLFAGSDVTRIDWLRQLIEIFDMSVEEDDYPDNYYSDIESDYKYYKDVMTATEFGLVDVYPDEAFNPDADVTRKFLAYTLNMCMGYVPDEEAYTYSEANSVDEIYKDAIQVALDRKWFSLSGKNFLPDQKVTSSEAEAILNKVKAVIADDEATATGKYEYKSNVKVLPSELVIETQKDGALLIKNYKNNAKGVKSGDIFGYVYMQENGAEMPLAWKADSVSVSGNDLKIKVSRVAMDKAFDSISVGVENEAPIEKAVATSDTAELYYVVGGSEKNNFEDGEFYDSVEALEGQTPDALIVKDEIDIPCDGKTSDLGDGAKATYSVTVTNFKYNWGATLQKAHFNTDFDVNVNASINVDFVKAANIDVPFASIPVAPGLFYDVGFRLKLDGKLAVAYVEHIKAGINWTRAGGVRFTKSFTKKSFTTTAELTGSIGFYASIHADYLVMDAVIFASMGMAGRYRHATYDSGTPRDCKSVEIWLYAEVGYEISIADGTFRERNNYVLYNDRNSPIKIGVHYEDGCQVAGCTRDSEFKKKTSKSAGYGGSNWFAPLNSQYYYSSSGKYINGSDVYSIFTYKTNDDGEAVITGYNGTAKNVFIPETLDDLYVVEIGDNAFKGKPIHSVTMTDRVKKIGIGAFQDCKSLSTVNLSNKIDSVEKYAFNGCTALTEIFIPKSLKSVNGFRDAIYWKRSRGAFANSGIKKVTFEDGMTTIPETIFTGCDSLEKVVMPDSVVTIEDDAFGMCSRLKDVKMSSSITTIGGYAFCGCTSLKTISFPETLKEIGWSGFDGCTSLSGVVLPVKFEKLCESAFANCTSLKEIAIPKTLVHFCEHEDFSFNWSMGCFSGSGVEKVIFEDGTTEIPKRALLNCAALKEIVMPESVTKIGYQSFAGCTGLTQVTLPGKVVEIGNNAFQKASGLQKIVLPDSLETIGSEAFSECSSLGTVTFPKGLKTIGNKAFNECKKIKEVKLEAPEVIGDWAFYKCSGITTVEIKSLKGNDYWNYGTSFFRDCKYLTKVVLPENEEYNIPRYAFNNCENLESIKIPYGVQTICERAFENCKSLEKIEIPDSVTTIESSAFTGCDELQELSLGLGIVEISNGMCSNCASLKSIVIPGRVYKIGESAFVECPMLSEAYIGKHVTEMADSSFSYYPRLTIYGIKGSYAESFAKKNGATFVEKTIPATTLEFKESSIKLPNTIEERALSLNVQPKNFNTGLVFSSSDSDIVRVDSRGILTPGTKVGTATITVRAGEKSASCKVETFVAVRDFEIGLDCNWNDVATLTRFQANVTRVYPEDAVDKTGTFEIDNYNNSDGKLAATVDKDGFVYVDNYADFLVRYVANDGGGGKGSQYVRTRHVTVDCSKDISKFESTHYTDISPNDYWVYYSPDATSITLTFSDESDGKIDLYSYNSDSIYLYDKYANGRRTGYEEYKTYNLKTDPRTVTLKGNYIRIRYSPDEKSYGFAVTSVVPVISGNIYKLSFDANGHGVAPEKMEVSSIPSSLPSITETGYTFGGWYKSKDCKNGEEAVAGTKLTKDTTLFAKWTANKYTVTFNAGSGKITSGSATKTVTYDKAYGDLPVAEAEDNAFDGWYTKAEGGSLVTKDTIVKTAGNHTLYAQYKAAVALSAPYVTAADGKRYESGIELEKGTKLYLKSDDSRASIYYTTNAKESSNIPKDDKHLYKNAINLVADTIIYAKAVKEGCKDSKTVSYTFKLINTAADWGDVTEEDRKGYTDADKIPTGLWVAGYKDVDYTGNAVTFEKLHVYYGKKMLSEGADYTLKYANNTKASTETSKATISITGKGNFAGTTVKKFNIKALSLGSNGKNSDKLSVADIQAEANGKVIKGVTTVVYKLNSSDVVLKKGTDFTYDYSGVQAGAGNYTVKVVGKGNYSGVATFKQTVYSQGTKTNIAKLKFDKIPAQIADGKAKTPSLTIIDKANARMLEEGKDYTSKYLNNLSAGTASVVVTGKGDYAGSKTVTFKIKGLAISKAQFTIGTATYNGSAVKPEYELAYQGIGGLAEDTDYTVTLSNNIKKGNGTIIFKGKGRFAGTAKKTFKINPLGLSGKVTLVCNGKSSSSANGQLGEFNYTKGGVKPEVQLTYNGRTLREGTDYKVKYANNKAIDGKTPTLTVTGKGNFGGSLTRTFTIKKSKLSNTTLVVNDLVATGKSGSFKPSVTLTDTNGAKLSAGKDYDKKNIKYTYTSTLNVARQTHGIKVNVDVKDGDIVDAKDIIPAGTVLRATVYGKGLYTGSVDGYFTYVNVLINKATVTLKKSSYDYTGKMIEISEDELTVRVAGADVPKGVYRITSIVQNVQKGTAKVTITGVGKYGGKYYGGSKTVTFKITARKIE